MIDETQFLCTCPTGFTGPTCDRSIMGKLTLLIYRCLKRRVGGGAHGGYSHRVRSQVVGPGNRRCLLTFMWFKSWFLKSDLFTWLSNSIWSFFIQPDPPSVKWKLFLYAIFEVTIGNVFTFIHCKDSYVIMVQIQEYSLTVVCIWSSVALHPIVLTLKLESFSPEGICKVYTIPRDIVRGCYYVPVLNFWNIL